ncbi:MULTISPECIES: M23 family metallopeptidase [unclassified Devosia]|uniref:M23 family metallopeptidase n=1 Tax=unclassified Devosia TaxID=196773 RepID=UPI000B09968B|nr:MULTISPECIES: M23 family metallopeptidase [unclassified Devosia]MBN9304163.1 M23 family metallopeptidase [Devosia sp.]
MSNRVAGQALRIAAFAGVALAATSLAGCSSLGLGMGGGDVTASTGPTNAIGGQQAMPTALSPISPKTQVAMGPYVPPEDISGGSGGLVTGSAPVAAGYTSSALPPLTGSKPMSAQPQLANPAPAPKLASLGTPQSSSSNLNVVPANAYAHTIESGESLYTIARKYNVTAQAIMQANSITSPEKIYVGQKVIIPGRADLAKQVPTKVASLAPVEAPLGARPVASAPAGNKTAAITNPKLVDPEASPATVPVQQVATAQPAPVKTPQPAAPQMSGADKFRWPVSGKVTTDFIASKGTGINIDAPEGSAVRAAENGTVIYVGSGVEGYGNLILIRHPNGYVSAYAHLKATGVSKGQTVSRGDNIGSVGMTGSVSRPQLHFELRQGATPVDPVPLLAG